MTSHHHFKLKLAAATAAALMFAAPHVAADILPTDPTPAPPSTTVVSPAQDIIDTEITDALNTPDDDTTPDAPTGRVEIMLINDLIDDIDTLAADQQPDPTPGEIAAEAALSQLGVRYRYAAAEPGVAFDCSGLTMWAWAQAGIELPHRAADQYRTLPSVDLDDIQPGDLLVNRSLGHVVMYVGDGQIVHAVGTGKPVEVRDWNRDSYDRAVRPGG